MRVTNELSDLGDEHQVPPRTMATMAATMIGLLCLAEVDGDVHADAAIDDFVDFCHRVMHLAVAEARINNGWTPPQ